MSDPQLHDRRVVKAAIFPAIGVARIGNSQNDFFLGPEVAEPLPEPWGFYRDCAGALKRQAARFRVYGLNAEGQAVCELNDPNAEVHWTVHLANKKAAWYRFQMALDIPEASSAPSSEPRNSTVADRASLIVDPGARHISGRNQHGGPAHTFDTGQFVGTPFYLGELRTDEKGRLIVLGGRGLSASFDGTIADSGDFANNDKWHDDVSDGPVTAEIHFKGKKLEVQPAWVIVAPPNYAPRQKSVRTMWDVMRHAAIQANLLPVPGRPSFKYDIRPLFERLSNLQWVNKGYAGAFGWGGWRNLSTPEWLHRLFQNDPADKELRQTIANEFRVCDRDSWAQQTLPWNYGDAFKDPPAHTPNQNARLTDTQLGMLQQWAKGDFDSDYDLWLQPPRRLDDLPVYEQPAMLDRASMEFCLADAFHPGCEMSWPMRYPAMYMSPFRVAHAPGGWVEPSYGPVLTADTLKLPNGPIMAGQLPGGITRWMAVPWQSDAAWCRSGYDKTYDPYLPTFWPARVPNQVLSRQSYEIVMDRKRPLAERMAAFAKRADWFSPFASKGPNWSDNMIRYYAELGVVEAQPGPGDKEFPDYMEVENLPASTRHCVAEMAKQGAGTEESPDRADRVDLTGIEKVSRFPHGLR